MTGASHPHPTMRAPGPVHAAPQAAVQGTSTDGKNEFQHTHFVLRRPMHLPTILGTEVLWNPFEDIVPRTTRAEREAVIARCASRLGLLGIAGARFVCAPWTKSG